MTAGETWPLGCDRAPVAMDRGRCDAGRTPAPRTGFCLQGIALALQHRFVSGFASAMASTPMSDSAGELLDQVLNPLLDDFQQSFERGLVLIAHCPDQVLAPPARSDLLQRLQRALAELQAARALRAAAPGIPWFWKCGPSLPPCATRG